MNQRQLSLEELIPKTYSLQKDNPRKLREMGSTDNLQAIKKTNFMAEDSQKIGNYSYCTKDQIGAGYTSQVYRCRSIKDSTQYALKVIDIRKYSTSSLQMLDNEIKILKKMNHPNILRLQAVIKEGNYCYLVTEYCGQGDLLQYITKYGKLCEKQATSIIAEVIQATKYLFKMGVIHRDIKPANIFKGGKNWKIGDFGFAINSQTQIKTKQNVGTPLYMPLQALLRNCYSPQSDIFSVGVIFYEMMVGITPWQSKSQKELIRKMNTMAFSIPQKYKITSPIKFLLEKMCCPSRDDRMTKEEFMDLKIDNFISLITFNQKLKSEEFHRRPRIFSRGKLNFQKSSKGKPYENQYLTNRRNSKNELKLIPKVQTKKPSKQKILDSKMYGKRSSQGSRSKSIQKTSQKKNQQKLQQKNCQILINQLNYCRFLYYLIQNGTYLQLSLISRGKTTLMTFKHLLKLIKHMSDNKKNWFSLSNWEIFKKGVKYETILKTLKEYCQKYQKQYLIFLKKAQINVIKEVNQKLPQFSTNQYFTVAFYRKMINFLTPLLHECNQNIATLQDIKQCRGEQGVARMQALRSLLKYYKLLDLSIKQFQKFTHFSSNSNITILKNYRQSKLSTADLAHIREQIKLI